MLSFTYFLFSPFLLANFSANNWWQQTRHHLQTTGGNAMARFVKLYENNELSVFPCIVVWQKYAKTEEN